MHHACSDWLACLNGLPVVSYFESLSFFERNYSTFTLIKGEYSDKRLLDRCLTLYLR